MSGMWCEDAPGRVLSSPSLRRETGQVAVRVSGRKVSRPPVRQPSVCRKRGDRDDCAATSFEKVVAPGVAEERCCAITGTVTGCYLVHAKRFQLTDRFADATFGLPQEMEPSQEEADRFPSLPLRSPHDVHDAWVGTAGDDHQPLVGIEDQRLLLRGLAHRSAGVGPREKLP